MGKGTDKLYITHSEWASEDAYSASAGSGTAKSSTPDASFKRLPFNFCAVSLQPFKTPVCTPEGTIFDKGNILSWLENHGTNPVNGQKLRAQDLIKLHFAKNEEGGGEMVDPVTFKVFTDNTHIVALRNTGNIFAYDTVERLNIKAKMWRDLVSDEEFGRKDIITLQDPQNVQSRNLSSFKYIQEGVSNLTEAQQRERNASVNKSALGNAALMLNTKESTPSSAPKVGKYLHQVADNTGKTPSESKTLSKTTSQIVSKPAVKPAFAHTTKSTPYNAAQHTTGQAAASFTSTGLTPHTSGDLALLSDEEYMLKPKRVKQKGYARIQTSLGPINLELLPEHAPKAVWSFVQLAKKGYYNGVIFHRNIRNFMLQGGDPTASGKGGQSVWGKNFADEFEGPQSHDARGVVSMANKGKNTNSSQFFITYRPCTHLDRKHTIFGRVVEGMDTLSTIEGVEVTDAEKRPLVDVVMEDVVIFVDPFEEFQKQRREKEEGEREQEEVRKAGGREDDKTTWTGKRVRGDGEDIAEQRGPVVGKYLSAGNGSGSGPMLEEWESEEPVKKKTKAGGFGSFDSW
ncbi:Peptidyl-prolyl cis-trans isomerase cyp8 [Mycoblastus sanguinarius]|nr:Peptidyl-prolyl cis-trans isomerase cyp8 [Mycoblastus sanguinarius]